MILVDTSVMIDYLKGRKTSVTETFHSINNIKLPYGITSLTYLEILQGSRDEKEFQIIKTYLESQKFYYLKDEKESYEQAAKIYFKCSKKGLKVGSAIDCIIAQVAIENDLFLLHNDSDFGRIALVSALKIFTPYAL